ncbi:MAG: SIMPL domain-containing protein [Candidatus Pacearchaeota archaeon]|jgi:uncharacterized protein YggE
MKKQKIDNSVKITLIIVLGVLVLGYMIYSSLPTTSANTVTGNGQATIKVMPDLVRVYFNVQTRGETSKEATNNNSEIVDDLITKLVKQGFERKQIETTNFNVYPDYIWDDEGRKENGYVATHSIRVELSTDDIDKIGNVVDAGVNAGAGVSYISFELSQDLENQYKAEALELAAKDAKTKAQAVANGLGKNLGKLVSTQGNDFNYYPWRIYESGGVASLDAASVKQEATNIQPGEQEVSASVQAVFELK